MLDTIVLTLNQTEFSVVDMVKFSPSAQGLIMPPYYPLGARGNFSCYQNPTKAELKKGIYKPRLTLTKRKAHVGFSLTLRCEFSAPKLVYGNNFDELLESDFARVLDILHHKLDDMGIKVKRAVLAKAQVSAIHYSKNVLLTDYATCAMVLGELGKVNLNKRLDLAKTDYRNEGHALRCHANSYEIAFYDKVKDLQQAKTSEKRAIECDNSIQKDLFGSQGVKNGLQVLRMEVRLGNRTKIKSMLRTLISSFSMEFENLFKRDISQKLLLHFWTRITHDMPLLALSGFKPEDIYHALYAESGGNAKPARILQQVGALAIMQNVGIRGLGSLVQNSGNARTWQRIKKELEGLDIAASMKYSAIRNVETALIQFELLKINVFRSGSCANKTL